MTQQATTQSTTEIFQVLKEILNDVTEDWDVGEITPDTLLIDLGMESISLVYLLAELQQHYDLGDRLFGKMRAEGTLLKEMNVDDVLTLLQSLIEST